MRATMEEHVQPGNLEVVLEGCTTDLPPFYLYFPKQITELESLGLLIEAVKQHISKF